jgi:hypothetical protein
MAVHWLHKGHTVEEAASKLVFYARKDPDLEGRHAALERLFAYERWHRESGRITTHVHLPLPPWEPSPVTVGGSVDRIDMLPAAAQPVQIIFLGRHAGHWRDELRMPLSQYALANAFGWPTEEVVVGVQLIDDGEPEIHHYSSADINAALAEFGELRRGVVEAVPGPEPKAPPP